MKTGIKSPVVADRVQAINDAKRRIYVSNFVYEIMNNGGHSNTKRLVDALARVYAELRLMNDVEDNSMLTP